MNNFIEPFKKFCLHRKIYPVNNRANVKDKEQFRKILGKGKALKAHQNIATFFRMVLKFPQAKENTVKFGFSLIP